MNKIYEQYGLKPYGAVPNKRQMEWYGRERTIFFHFGMNTFTGKEWGDGDESPELFNPSELSCEQWVKAIKDGGFTTAILTAKHHDGFCLWPSKYTEHSVKNSPYKNGQGDVVREFTDACAKYGIKAGIYLSPWDRHEPTWGKDEYNDYYVGQLAELLTNYGKIWECWWDGAGSTEAVYDWERWANTVRSLQPDAVIFGSLGATPWVDVRWVGNEKGVAGKPCYATIDPHSLVVENTYELNHGKLDGERFIPAEVDVSIRPGWFYHTEQDNMVRSPENLVELWFTSIGSNAGLLLNLPPDRRGLIHENDVESIKRFNEIITSILNSNLALDGEFTGESVDNSSVSSLISAGEFYVSGKTSFAFEVRLPEKREINALAIGECIELGHKVTSIKAIATLDGEKKLLFRREMIGHTLAERFATVKTDLIRVEIEALDVPALKDFGLYRLDDYTVKAYTKDGRNILSDSLVKIDKCEKEIDVNLGGLIPFNRISLKNVGDVSFKIYVFNGTAFDLYADGKSQNGQIEYTFDMVVDIAYRFKVVFDKPISDDTKIEAYLV